METRNPFEESPLWRADRSSGRGPRPSLTLDHLARAAIRLADDKGLASVTMQSLARQVGLTPMALYRYVGSKADVIGLMIDSVTGPPSGNPGGDTPWDMRLGEWARKCLGIYRRHPWFLEATTIRVTPMGPNELSWMEAALALLAESGLRQEELLQSFLAIVAHVRGHATFEEIPKGLSGRASIGQLGALPLSQKKQYPVLHELLSTGFPREPEPGAFEFGLDCLLRGISKRAAQFE